MCVCFWLAIICVFPASVLFFDVAHFCTKNNSGAEVKTINKTRISNVSSFWYAICTENGYFGRKLLSRNEVRVLLDLCILSYANLIALVMAGLNASGKTAVLTS